MHILLYLKISVIAGCWVSCIFDVDLKHFISFFFSMLMQEFRKLEIEHMILNNLKPQ